MPSNPYQSKRVQVVFSQTTRDAMEAFGEDRGLTNSKAVAYLVEEALRARGLLEEKTVTKSEEEPITKEMVASRSWYQRWKAADPVAAEAALNDPETTQGEYLMQRVMVSSQQRNIEPLTTETLTRETSTSIQEQKLRLMQDLMEQLKTL